MTAKNLQNVAFAFCNLPCDFGFVHGQTFVRKLLQFIKNLSDDDKSILRKIVEENDNDRVQINKDRILGLI